MSKSLIVLVIMLAANVPTVFSHLSAAQEKTGSQNDERELMKCISFGQTHYKNKAYDKALPNFWLAVELDKSNRFPMLFDKIARCYWRLGKMDSTELAYRKGIAANPNSAHYYRSLGWTLRAKMQHDEAIKAYERAIELQAPPKAEDFEALAGLYFVEDYFKEAEEARNKVAALRPNKAKEPMFPPSIFSNLKIYEKALDNEPENQQVRHRLAHAYFISREFEKSAGQFALLLENKPNDIQMLGQLAFCYENMESYVQAIGVYERLSIVRPSLLALCRMARCFSEIGQFSEAWDTVQRASYVDALSGFPHIVSGEICERMVKTCMVERGSKVAQFDDELVLNMAYRSYELARSDPRFAKVAQRRMDYLKVAYPATADRQMNQGRNIPILECYSWLRF